MTDAPEGAPLDPQDEGLLPLTLCADSLWSRYGFGDGNPFEFIDRGPDFDDQPYGPLRQAISDLDACGRADLLERLVTRHLVPVIERATGSAPRIVRIGTQHNQVRDADFRHGASMPEGWDDIAVTLTSAQVAEALQPYKDRP